MNFLTFSVVILYTFSLAVTNPAYGSYYQQPEKSDRYSFNQWYVSGLGSDSNDGKTIKTSFRTLKKAAEVVGAGDIVLIGNGIYEDTSRNNSGSLITISKSGRPDAWITWKALPGQRPELHASGWGGITITSSYHVLDGLTIIGRNDSLTLKDALNDAKNTTPNSVFNTNGIVIDGRRMPDDAKPHHVIIKNCSVGKCPGGGITVLEADYVTVEDCSIFDNAWYMRYAGSGLTTLNNWAFDDKPGYHIIIQRNLVWNNKTLVPWERTGKLSDGNGILLDVTDLKTGATNPNADSTLTPNIKRVVSKRPEWKGRALIANNISAYNGGSGIHTFRTSHVDIINNTTYWNGSVVGYEELFPNRSSDIVILNNIIVPRPGGRVTSDNRNEAIRWDYNLYPSEQKVFKGEHDIVREPLFYSIPVRLTTKSFLPKKGSPAIGTGTDDLQQATDIEGKKRPIATKRDRGANEQ
ncbi:MAG: right-handed parallel beta-helix repeat-containing protein [Chitinophagaceae bacterium]|nr:right-handed parallel beta-helix repeat-containing protein [Chitinophagaceae bacterium]